MHFEETSYFVLKELVSHLIPSDFNSAIHQAGFDKDSLFQDFINLLVNKVPKNDPIFFKIPKSKIWREHKGLCETAHFTEPIGPFSIFSNNSSVWIKYRKQLSKLNNTLATFESPNIELIILIDIIQKHDRTSNNSQFTLSEFLLIFFNDFLIYCIHDEMVHGKKIKSQLESNFGDFRSREFMLDKGKIIKLAEQMKAILYTE